MRSVCLACPLLVLGAALVLAGCGGGPLPVGTYEPTNDAQVQGKVTINGKPASGGKIYFKPIVSDPEAAEGSGTINADGTYTATASAGRNSVSLDTPEITADPKLQEYAMHGKLDVELQKGDNTHDVRIP